MARIDRELEQRMPPVAHHAAFRADRRKEQRTDRREIALIRGLAGCQDRRAAILLHRPKKVGTTGLLDFGGFGMLGFSMGLAPAVSVRGVAGANFIGDRKTIGGHDEGDDPLHAAAALFWNQWRSRCPSLPGFTRR